MSRLGEEGDSLQVDALVYFLGDDTEDILSASILAGAKKTKVWSSLGTLQKLFSR